MSNEGLVVGEDGVTRCWWAGSDAGYRAYHDSEWGFPVADDVRLFEKLSLEGFQAGLSWLTILRKREAFRAAFAGFDFARVAGFGEARRAAAARRRGHRPPPRQDRGGDQQRRPRRRAGRGRGLACALRLALRAEARRHRLDLAGLRELATTRESKALAKDLKRAAGASSARRPSYAFMQAMGLVDDHLAGCDAGASVERARRRFTRP